MHKLTANTDGLTEVEASQQGSTDLEIRAEQIATAAMGELHWKIHFCAVSETFLCCFFRNQKCTL